MTVLTLAVPGSSAHLGPGFDSLAVALSLKLTLRVDRFSGSRIHTNGEGSGELPTDDSNLIWRAVDRYCDWAGVDRPDISLWTENEIPLERGLGSSAAAAVAGVMVGKVATGGPGCDDELIALAAE